MHRRERVFPAGILNRAGQTLQSAFDDVEKRGNGCGIVGRDAVAFSAGPERLRPMSSSPIIC